ncbi:hypothetical protein [Haladaptatus sp. GCM10025893]|uniref:hypothetical protein n=1 Tax=Haladaptatus sp. GCM10025893 TaxID=3252659 RepID=UPI003611FB33
MILTNRCQYLAGDVCIRADEPASMGTPFAPIVCLDSLRLRVESALGQKIEDVIVTRVDRPVDQADVTRGEVVTGAFFSVVHRFGIRDADLAH